ncbi:MAG: SusC/RagA family TonB-linked outer membrane protein [Dysgonamonadaceae bacterium]|nr:SusC/RagA family TonB-linked outer membrane protein [Dysgonamonadaceae bacterium]
MRKKILLLLLVFFQSAAIFAQNVVRGTIIDATTREALTGALINVKTTNDGAYSDVDGKFEIKTKAAFPLIIEIHYLGYHTREVSIGNSNSVQIELTENQTVLNEVVVVGYGTSTKKDLVGSVSRIGTEDIKATAMNNSVQGLLQGKTAGVSVNIGSASPSAPVMVTVRGKSSLSGDGQPLWVIDGVPQYLGSNAMSDDISNTLYNLNINDVESIDILKDASSTAIYGSRAANGVIIVTTKSGAKGMKPVIEISARRGVQKIDANGFNVFTKDEYIAYAKAALPEQAMRYGGLDSFCKRFIDANKFNQLTTSQWNKTLFTDDMYLPGAFYDGNDNYWNLMTRDANTEQYDISLRGGNENTSYYSSFFYNNQLGVVKGSEAQTFGGRFNFENKLRNVLKFGVNLDASARSYNDKDYMIERIIQMRPDYPAYNEDGSINTIDFYVTNPLVELLNREYSQNRSFRGTLFLEYDIKPYLKAKTSGTMSYSDSKYDNFYRKSYTGGNNSANISNYQNYLTMWENLLTFYKTFGKHDVQAVVGHAMEKNWNETLGAAGTTFPDDDILTNLSSAAVLSRISSGYSASTLLSVFARAQYKFNNRYLLTATYRADASSRFGADSRWGYFPSGGVGWIVTEEKFAKGLDPYLSYLKLRASVGKTGSQNLGNYDWQTLMGSARYNNQPGIVPSSIGNSLLQWEQQMQTDIGMDFGIFNERITGSLVWYQKNVDNLLYNKPIPISSSFTSVTQNIGSIRNNGIEFDFSARVLNYKDLKWEIDFNIAKNEGKLVKLNGIDKELYLPSAGNPYLKLTEGDKFGSFYGYLDAGRLIQNAEEMWALKPIDPATGKQGYYRTSFSESAGDVYVVDVNGDGKITTADRTVIGNSNPDFWGGFGSTLFWKGFRVNLNFSYSVGAQRYWQRENSTGGGAGGLNVYNGLNFLLENWTMLGEGAKYPHTDFYGRGDNYVFTNRWLHDASYLRLNALNISYRLSDKLFKDFLVQNVEFTFQATNLFTLTNYPGMDPQGNFNTNPMYGLSLDSNSYPSAKNFNFGVKFTLK